MSQVAGRCAIQAAACVLEKANGGQGMLLGGVPGVPPANVVILGGGRRWAPMPRRSQTGKGAEVTVFDLNIERLR